MTDTLHLEIGDSLARMSDARAMLFSRDPHLAAIGLYWMPLPTVGQLPFMLLLSPLHHAQLSGPLACAFIGAVTVLVMTRICWVLELPTLLSGLLVGAYALSPIIVYTNGNGMSEAWSYFGCAVAMLGYIRWSKRHNTMDLAVLATGLAIVMLVRYEALLLTPIIAVITALNDGQGPPDRTSLRDFIQDCRSRTRRWATTASLVALPTYVVIGLWSFMQYVLVRNPFNWYDLQVSHGRTAPGAFGLPAYTAAGIGGYTLHLLVLIVPAVIVVGPALLLLRRRYHDILTGLGILAGVLIWPAIVVIGLVLHDSSAAPRYFEPAIIFVAIGAIWLASVCRSWTGRIGRIGPAVLVVIMAAGAIAGTANLENKNRTFLENENQVFDRVLGRPVAPLPLTALAQAVVWRQVANDLDPKLAAGARVMVDVSDTSAFIFTKYPGHYIVNSDRDYLKIVADFTGHFTYLIKAGPKAVGDEDTEFNEIIASTVGGHWIRWKSYPVAIVYQWIPAKSSPGP